MQQFERANTSTSSELPKSTSCPDSIAILSELEKIKDSKVKSIKFNLPPSTSTSTATTSTTASTTKPTSSGLYATYSPTKSSSSSSSSSLSAFSTFHQKSLSLNSPNKQKEINIKSIDFSFSLFSITTPTNHTKSSSSSSTSSTSSSSSTVPSSSSTSSSPSSSPPPHTASFYNSNNNNTSINATLSPPRARSSSDSQKRSSGDMSSSSSNGKYSNEWDYDEEEEEDQEEEEVGGIIRKVRHSKYESDELGDEYNDKKQGWKKISNFMNKEKRLPHSLSHHQGLNEVRRVHSDNPPASSTASVSVALNFPTRPLALPPKNQTEQKKHRKMHEEMMKIARIKEEKEQKKNEEREKIMTVRTMLWENHILPQWEVKKNNRRTMVLWEQGLPPKVRGRVWKNAIGNSLNITEELFQICVERANAAKKANLNQKIGREESVEQIKTDLHRTFPTIKVFQPGGPFHNSLEKVLQAYACYRPDIGYVQGMSFIASILLLNMEELDAFICLCNLLNRSSLMIFYQLESIKIQAYAYMFTALGKDILPDIFNHLQRVNLEVNIFLLDWILTLYSKSLSLENASRVWDCYLLYGDYYLFKTALGILKLLEKRIINQPFDSIAFDLTHLPQMDEDHLFEAINSIPLGEKRFQIAANRYLLK